MAAREKPPENTIFQLVRNHAHTSAAIPAQCAGMATALADQFVQVPGEIKRLYTLPLTLILQQKKWLCSPRNGFLLIRVYYFHVPTDGRGGEDNIGGAGQGRECPDTLWSQTK